MQEPHKEGACAKVPVGAPSATEVANDVVEETLGNLEEHWAVSFFFYFDTLPIKGDVIIRIHLTQYCTF